MKNKYSVFIATAYLAILFYSCKKDGNDTPFCVTPLVIPYQPYLNPVWHPNAVLLGFNYQPLSGVYKNGTEPCVWYMNSIKADSVGFYIMNKNGTGLKRVTNYMLGAPSWSPDGTSIAFSLGPNIYKMPFNGSTFDTSQIVPLTNIGGNFYPSWTQNSDSIYFDSNNNAPLGTSFYSIWKMASNGSGKTRLTQSAGIGDTRQPFVGSDNKIYYVGYYLNQPEIFSMNKDGTSITQLTNNGSKGVRRYPKYYSGKLFYWDARLYYSQPNLFVPQELTICNETYDISNNGSVVYIYSERNIPDRRFGTLWTMNIDGTNKQQITFNNY